MTWSEEAFEINKRANRYRRENRPQEALDAYRAALSIDPNFIKAWGNLGLLFGSHNHFEKAETCFQHALEVDPEHSWALQAYAALIMTKDERWKDAEDLLQRAIKADPTYPAAYRTLGVLLMDKDVVQAESAFRKCLELDPDDRQSLYYFGKVLLEAEKWGQAEDMAKQVLEMDPDYAKGWDLLGQALYALGDMRGAIDAFDRVTDLDPDNMRAWYKLGMTQKNAGYLRQAAVVLKKTVAMSLGFVEAWDNLIEVVKEIGIQEDIDEVIDMYESVLEANPGMERGEDGFLQPKGEVTS